MPRLVRGLSRTICFFCFAVSIGACWAAESRLGIGLNKYELFLQYLGTASHGDGSAAYRQVTRDMARKAIGDAKNLGVSYFRVSVMGYFPVVHGQTGNLELWRSDPAAFWQAMDRMMADLDAHEIRLIPVFVWNKVQLPAMTGETVADLVTNPESQSHTLLVRFITEFIARYRSRSTVLFYELTNELNLGVDLDSVARCRRDQPPSRCAPLANYSTAQMLGFTSRLASLVRRLDPARRISSGFSVPRPAAESLRRKPEWLTGRADWTADSKEDLARNLLDTHQGVDIISVHLYPFPENRRFGGDEIALLDTVKKAADQAGKPLFVGEFGGPSGEGIAPDSFMDKMIERIAMLDVPYSAAWAWQFYQTAPHVTRDTKATSFALEPGYSDRINAVLRSANSRLSGRVPETRGKDVTPPEVVITWPLPCTSIKGKQLVHAVASDDRGRVGRVEFWMGDILKATDSAAPYQWELDAAGLSPGEYKVQVKAFDEAGNVSSMARPVFVGESAKAAACSAALPD